MQKKGKLISKEESQKVKEKHLLSQEEVNTLESMLEKDEGKMDVSEIREILKEARGEGEKTSPSLEKVNAPQRVPTRLEANIGNTPVSNNNSNGEDDSFKYTSGEIKTGGTKYTHYEGGTVGGMVEHIDLQNIGRGRPLEKREIGFENSPQAKISPQESFEKYATPPNPKRVDKDQLGKEKQFQRKEVKYTPEKY